MAHDRGLSDRDRFLHRDFHSDVSCHTPWYPFSSVWIRRLKRCNFSAGLVIQTKFDGRNTKQSCWWPDCDAYVEAEQYSSQEAVSPSIGSSQFVERYRLKQGATAYADHERHRLRVRCTTTFFRGEGGARYLSSRLRFLSIGRKC